MSEENAQSAAGPGPALTERAGRWPRIFRRIFGQDLFNAMLLVGLVWAIGKPMLVPNELVKDSDLWWHLANARILTTTHHFIRVEPYSFAVAGERWIDPEWLAEMPYWFGYSSLGLRGIHLAALLGLCANLLFVYFRSCWNTRNRKAAFWTAVLAFFLMTVNSGARTIVIAYLALSAEMAIIEAAERGKKRLLWLLPPLFCIWINLHGSWLIGLGYFGLYIVCGLFPVNVGALEQRAFSAADRSRLILAFVASAAALWLNPYGWRLVWNPFDMLFNQKVNLAVVEEWSPLSLSTSTGIAAVAAIGLMLAANLVRGRKWKLYELAFIFSAWHMAFSHQRFAFLACVVTIPWLAADGSRSFYGELSETTIPAMNALFAAAILGWCIYSFPHEAELQKDLATGMPLQTISSIQPSWRTFNDYSLGGMMAFQSKPNFLDSRVDTFEHHGVLQQYLAIENLSDPYRLLDANLIDHVLTRADGALAFTLEHSQGWRVETREGAGDNAYELFARVPSP
ncbi:MAG: hypothetical protein ABSF23_02580 [Terracidiphilus sp.]|jgi:hypothetical protein